MEVSQRCVDQANGRLDNNNAELEVVNADIAH